MPTLDPNTVAQLLSPQPIGGRPPPPFFQQQQVPMPQPAPGTIRQAPMPQPDPRGSTFLQRLPPALAGGSRFGADVIPSELMMHKLGYPSRPDKNVYSPYDIMNVILKVNPFKQAKA